MQSLTVSTYRCFGSTMLKVLSTLWWRSCLGESIAESEKVTRLALWVKEKEMRFRRRSAVLSARAIPEKVLYSHCCHRRTTM